MIKSKIAIILARRDSKGIPGKNWIDMGGIPLIKWSILAALEDDVCDCVVVSTDSNEIKQICESMNDKRIICLSRPKCYCTDSSPSELSLLHACSTLTLPDDCKICFLQPTSPFRYGEVIKNCLNLLTKGNSVFTAFKHTPLFWKKDESNNAIPQYSERKMRQDFSSEEFLWHDCGNAYAFYKDDFCRHGNRHFGSCSIVECDAVQSMQIDNFNDLDICRKVIELDSVKKWYTKIANS